MTILEALKTTAERIKTWADNTFLKRSDASAENIGADAAGTAETKVSSHNTSSLAHSDIRTTLQSLQTDMKNQEKDVKYVVTNLPVLGQKVETIEEAVEELKNSGLPVDTSLELRLTGVESAFDIVKSTNLLNPNEFEVGRIVENDSGTGVYVDSADTDYLTSGFIPVNKGDLYTVQIFDGSKRNLGILASYATYMEDKETVVAYVDACYSASAGSEAAYIRISFPATYEQPSFVKGTEVVPFDEYGKPTHTLRADCLPDGVPTKTDVDTLQADMETAKNSIIENGYQARYTRDELDKDIKPRIETLETDVSTLLGNELPSVTASDNGKVLMVKNGAWTVSNVSFAVDANGVLSM